jgi:methionyl aminopeptidase
MITYKTDNEVQIMAEAGKMLHTVLSEVPDKVKVGVTTDEINQFIDDRIHELGGEPGFKRVKGYKWASCICINEQVVHTPPSKKVVKEGDVVTIDSGVYLKGLHTDRSQFRTRIELLDWTTNEQSITLTSAGVISAGGIDGAVYARTVGVEEPL